MSRIYNSSSIYLLELLKKGKESNAKRLHSLVLPAKPYKEFYNLVFRLQEQELVRRTEAGLELTEEGEKLLARLKPQKDGVWKMVIFDIPEKHQRVRNILRAKLKQLHFKKWQNSIWITPFALDSQIEKEFSQLAEKYFIRLIKFADINYSKDLDEMF